MKVRVSVEISPAEADLGVRVEAELRNALLGLDSEVSIENSAAQLPRRLCAALKSSESGEVVTWTEAPIADLSSAFAELVCSDSSVHASFAATVLKFPDAERTQIVDAVVEVAAAVLSTCHSEPLDRVRTASSAIVVLVDAGVFPLANAARASMMLLRKPETVTAGATLLATLVSRHGAALQQWPECPGLRKAVAAVSSSIPPYENVFIAEGMGWSPPFVVTSSRRVAAHQPTSAARNGLVVGLAMSSDLVAVCTTDGNLHTFNHLGLPTLDTCSVGDVMPTAIDFNSHTKQVVVAAARRHGAPVLSLLAEVENRQAWVEQQQHVLGTDVAIVTALRSFKHSPQTLVAKSDGVSNTVQLVHQEDASVVGSFDHHTDVVTALHVPQSRDYAAMSGSRDRTAVLFDIRSGQKAANMAVHTSTITSISSEGDVLVVTGLDGKVAVCDLRMMSTPVGKRTFDTGVVKCALGPSHVCAVATQNGVHLLSLHSSEMPIARLDVLQDGALCSDLGWVPGQATLCMAAGGQVEFVRCDQSV